MNHCSRTRKQVIRSIKSNTCARARLNFSISSIPSFDNPRQRYKLARQLIDWYFLTIGPLFSFFKKIKKGKIFFSILSESEINRGEEISGCAISSTFSFTHDRPVQLQSCRGDNKTEWTAAARLLPPYKSRKSRLQKDRGTLSSSFYYYSLFLSFFSISFFNSPQIWMENSSSSSRDGSDSCQSFTDGSGKGGLLFRLFKRPRLL